ncbi:hypothetical protein [Obesumbacterium proteus]
MMDNEQHSLNLGEVKGASVYLDAATMQRIKQYRIRQLKEHPDKPLVGGPMLVRFAVNQWLDGAE